MKSKIYKLSYVFIFCWVMGEVFKQTYFENLVWAVWMSVAGAIYLGIHQDIKNYLRGAHV